MMREAIHKFLVDATFELNNQLRHLGKIEPCPFVEFLRMAIGWWGDLYFILVTVEAVSKPPLLLPAKLALQADADQVSGLIVMQPIWHLF